MKVVAYLSGVPSPHKNPNKIEVLTQFIKGVNLLGDNGILHKGQNLIECDLGIIQGWVHEGSPHTPHLNLRKKVSENKFNKNTLIIDSNLFNYVPDNKNLHYRRYSLNGIFPTTGTYFDNQVDPKKWQQIQKDMQISLKTWRKTGTHILVCCQRNGGWSMKGLPVTNWLDNTITTIQKYTDRPIVIRAHPGDKMAPTYLRKYKLSKNINLLDDLKNAWAMVNYNSSPGVAAAIEGIPIFVTDPNPKFSQASPVANLNLQQIENPSIFDRQPWLEKLAMSHWNFIELSNGTAWKHMRNCMK